jgi:hypothetical protein
MDADDLRASHLPNANVFRTAQTHHRFIKTHTPLDGIPLDSRATYLVVARNPLDAVESLHHQGANIDRAKYR